MAALCSSVAEENIVTSNYTLAHVCFPAGVEELYVAPVSALHLLAGFQTALYSRCLFITYNMKYGLLQSAKCITVQTISY